MMERIRSPLPKQLFVLWINVWDECQNTYFSDGETNLNIA